MEFDSAVIDGTFLPTVHPCLGASGQSLVLGILDEFNDRRRVTHLSVNGLGVPMSLDPMTMTIDPCPVLRVEYCM